MPLELGSERYGARRPMGRPRYGLCGGSGRCAQPAPCKLEQIGVSGGPQTPKTGQNESSRRKIESFDLFARQYARPGH
jgi:hypothetical protein